MRPVVILASLLVLLLPISTVASTSRNSTIPANKVLSSSQTSLGTGPTTVAATPPIGLVVIVRSVFGVAFYNSSGKIIIQPATLFLNMTVKAVNSTGVIFTITTGRITIGPSPIVTSPMLFTLAYPGSGQAFLSFSGRLTITAVMTEIFPCQQASPPCMVPSLIWQLFLAGPARLASTSTTWTLFTSLFGFLYNAPSQPRIGLFFIVGITPGDLDEDGRVDILDAALLASSYGADTTQLSTTAPSSSSSGYSTAFYADLDGDGQVTILDAAILAFHYGQTY